MFELHYEVFGRDGRIVSKRKSFTSDKALRAFIDTLRENGNFYRILAYADPV